MTAITADWTAFYEELRKFVAARVRVPSDVDDLVQLVLERAMAKAASAEVVNVAGWLFAIARHAVADYYRQQARTLVSAAEDLEAEAVEAPLGTSDDERARVIACMGRLLDALAPDEAQLLRWADMEGSSMQAIADRLHVSVPAVKSRVQRARKAFVKATRDCCAIVQDARGRVIQLTPHPIPKALDCAACADRSVRTKRIRS